MPNHLRPALAFLVLALLTVACGDDDAPVDGAPDSSSGADAGPADAAPEVDADPRFAPLIEAVEAERAAYGAPAVAVAVIEDGQVTFARGFGERAAGAPARSTTLFRIGSCTKMLTATALLREVEAGRVALDEPIATYLPDFAPNAAPSAGEDVTVRHLLTHSHALVDYLEIDAPSGEQTDAALASFLTGRFEDLGFLMAPPGSFYNYSNPGFMLAGLIAEVSGDKTYRTLLHDGVLAPLGMDRTLFLADEVLADGDYAEALNTAFAGLGPEILPDSYDNPWGRPAGYAWSSVLDLARFVAFLLDGGDAVLGAALRSEMQSAVRSTREAADHSGYGYGLMTHDGFFLYQDNWLEPYVAGPLGGAPHSYYDLPIVTHGGAIPGFAAELFYVPSLRFGFVTLASTDGAYLRHSFGVALTTLADLPAATEEPADLAVDPGRFAAYAGSYLDLHNVGHLEILVGTEGGLEISMPEVDAAGIDYDPALVPLAGDSFLLAVDGGQLVLTFIADSSGAYRFARTRVAVGERVVTKGPAIRIDTQRLRARLREPSWPPVLPGLPGLPGQPELPGLPGPSGLPAHLGPGGAHAPR